MRKRSKTGKIFMWALILAGGWFAYKRHAANVAAATQLPVTTTAASLPPGSGSM